MAPLRSAALAAALALRLLLAVLLLQRLSDATAAGAAQPLFSLRRHTRPCRTPECCNLRMRQLLEKKEYEHYLNDPGLLALHREMNRFLMKQDSRDGEVRDGRRSRVRRQAGTRQKRCC